MAHKRSRAEAVRSDAYDRIAKLLKKATDQLEKTKGAKKVPQKGNGR